jgi:hypothetical protein
MEALMTENIVIDNEEFNRVSNYVFSSIAIKKENTEVYKYAFMDAYANYLKKLLLNDYFDAEQEAEVIHFLSQMQLQKELLEVSTNSQKLMEYQKAGASFAKKTALNA